MSFINKIGLEAEFLLRNAKGALVYPGTHGFDTDDFCILGEIRGAPGTSRAETIAHFLKAYWTTVFKARTLGLTLDLKGWASISPKTHAAILRKQDRKHVAQCENLHGLDILELTDAKVEDGKINEHLISTGLHVHFSSEIIAKGASKARGSVDTDDLATLFGSEAARAKLLLRLAEELNEDDDDDEDGDILARASRISEPIIDLIVRGLDSTLLPVYTRELPKLKYRNAGFFERKGYGFEYRSLPFTEQVLADLDKVTVAAFDILESIDKRPKHVKVKKVKDAKGVMIESTDEINPEIAS